jgi:hypothetical protein
VKRGEGLLFVGSALTHNMVEIEEGERNSLDILVHQSNFDVRRVHQQQTGKEHEYDTGATVAGQSRSTEKRKRETKKTKEVTAEEKKEKEKLKDIQKGYSKLVAAEGDIQNEEWVKE